MIEPQEYIKIRGFSLLINYGITRVETSLRPYWVVRLDYVEGKPRIQKYFSDFRYNSKVLSFDAAFKFRNTIIPDSVLCGRTRKRKQLKVNIVENFKEERYGTKEFKKEWRKERLRRCELAINKYGRRTVYLGIGRKAAEKARELGAGNRICRNILRGKQDNYKLFRTIRRQGPNLIWKGRKANKNADREKQKQTGKKLIILGVGGEAAAKAQNLGASQQTCLRIYRGEQSSFLCCNFITHFELNGFRRIITKEIADTIYSMASIYSPNSAQDIAAEVMLNYSSREEIPSHKGFLKILVLKYVKISKLKQWGGRRKISLDINGDIERYKGQEKNTYGVGVKNWRDRDYFNKKQEIYI